MAIFVAVVTFIIVAIIRGVRKDTSGDNFQDIIRTMYIYIVMIVFLIMLVSSTIFVFRACMEILLPDVSQNLIQRNTNIADLTTNAVLLCISIPMFAYYSTLAKKENKLGSKKKEEEN